MSAQVIPLQSSVANRGDKLDRYRLLVALGQGGMGTIHLAVAGGLDDFRKLLVVKELRRDLTRNPRFVEMFLDEAKLAARLNHPNVVQTIEAGRQDDRFFLCMEFLDGQPLNHILLQANRSPEITIAMRLRILCDALAGLHYAHELTEYDGEKLHIVHRDVSPQNIFVTYDGQVKVVDFGIAKAALSDSMSTTPGIFKGKFGYASPEQVRGETVDARSDVFSVGVVLWEALTLRRFADGPLGRAAISVRLAGGEPRLRQAMPSIDPRLAAICDRALQVDPARRYGSAEEFRRALEQFLTSIGQAADASALRQVLVKKFADERKALHRLIDSHIKHGAVSSEIRDATSRFHTDAGNDNPTTVADLSKFIQSSNGETVVSAISYKPLSFWQRNRRSILIGAAVGISTAAIYARFSTHTAPPALEATIVSVPLTAEPAPAVPSVVAPPATGAVAPLPPPVAAAPQPEPSAPSAPMMNVATSVRSSVRVAPRSSSRRSPLPPSPALSATAQPEPAAERKLDPEPSPRPSASSEMGSDLKRLPDQRRAIDTEL